MEGKVTYTYIADLLAREYGTARNFSEDFINQLVNIINDGFTRSSHVEINGLGSFDLTAEGSVEPTIVFTAAKDKKTDLEKYALKAQKKGMIFVWMGIFVVLVIIIGLVYFFRIHKKEPKVLPVPAELFSEVAKSDTLIKDTTKKVVPLIDTHIVVKRESLWKIAGVYYPSKLWWPLIYNENKETVKNPDFIKPGMKILVPKKKKVLPKMIR